MTNTQIDITFLEEKKQQQHILGLPGGVIYLTYKWPNKRSATFAQPPSMMRNSPLLKKGHFILSAVINIESSLLLENTFFIATSTITTP